jgi:hypothetical protein
MARFYASIQGQDMLEATRRGSKKSGIGGHIRGWDTGIRVEGRVNATGDDEFDVYLTGGSNRRVAETLMGTFSGGKCNGKVFV